MAQTVDKIAEMLESMNNSANTNAEDLKKTLDIIASKLETLKGNGEDSEEILLKLENIKTNFAEITDSLHNNFREIDEGIKSTSDTGENLSNKLSKLEKSFNKSTQNYDKKIKEVSEKITEIVLSNKEETASAIDNLKNNVSEFLNMDLEKVLNNLRNHLDESFARFSVDTNSELVSGMESVSKLEQLYKETYNKLDTIEDLLSEKLQGDIALLNTVVESGVSGIKQKLEETLDDKFDVVIKNNKITSSKQEEILSNISSLAAGIKSFISETVEKMSEKIVPEQIKTDLSNTQEKLDILDAKIDTVVNNDVNYEIMETVESTEIKIDNINSALNNFEAKSNDVNLKLNGLRLRADNANTKLDDLDKKIVDIDKKIDNLDFEPSDFGMRIDHLSAKSDGLNFKIDDLDLKSDSLNSKIDDLSSKIENINLQSPELDDKIDSLDTKFDYLSSKIENIDFQPADYDDKFDTLELKSDTISSRVSDIDTKIDDLGSKIENIDFKNPELDSKIDSLDTKFDYLSSKIENIDFQPDELQFKIENIDTKSDGLNTKISDLDLKIDGLDLKSDGISSTVESLDTKFDDLNSKIDNIDFKNPELDSKIESLDLKSDSINWKVSDVDAKIDDLGSKIENIDFKNPELDSKIESLDSKLDGLDLKSDDTNFKLSGLDSKVNEISSKFDNFDTKSDEINSKIDNLSFKSDDINTKIQDLNLTVSSSDTRLQSIISETLNTLYEKVDILASDDSKSEIISELNNIRETFERNSNTNYSGLLLEITNVSNVFNENFSKLDLDRQNMFLELKTTVSDLLENLQKIFEESQKINVLDANIEIVKNRIDEISYLITGISNTFETTSSNNAQNIINSVKDLDSKIDDLKAELNKPDNSIQILNLISDLALKFEFLSTDEEIAEKVESLKEHISEQTSAYQLMQAEQSEKISENFEKQSDKLNTIIENVKDVNFNFATTIDSLKGYFKEIDENVRLSAVQTGESLSEKLADLETLLNDNKQNYEVKLDVLHNRITEFVSTLENNNIDTESKISTSLEEISGIKDELLIISEHVKASRFSADEKLNDLALRVDSNIDNIVNSINELNENIKSGVETSVKESIDIIENRFDRMSDLLEEVKNNNSTNDFISDVYEKITTLKDEFTLINTDITALVLSSRDETVSAIENLKQGISEFVNLDSERILREIRGKLDESFASISVDLHSEIITGMESVSNLEQAYKDTFKEAFNKLDLIEEYVTEKTGNDITILNNLIESGIQELKQTFENGIEDKIDAINTSLNLALDNTRVESSVNELRDELLEKFEVVINSNKTSSLKQEEILSGVWSITDNLKTFIVETAHSIVEDCIPEEMKSDIKSVNEKLDTLNIKIDSIANDNTNYEIIETLENTSQKISNLDFKFGDLDLKTSDMDAKITGLESKSDKIVSKVDNLDFKSENLTSKVDDVDFTVSNIDSKLDSLVSETLNTLNAKVDILASDNSDLNVLDELDNIKEIIFEQRKFFEASSDEKSAAIDKYLKDVLFKIESVDLEKNSEDIKETILNALLSVVNQITFVEETEEIKDFVEEKTNKINKGLDDVREKLRKLLDPDDDFSYVYTLQDVESDMARLRLAISNLKGNDYSDITEEIGIATEQVEKLKDDILSISTRTNKLLINSDDANKAINDGLSSFSDIIRNNSKITQRLEEKLDNVQTLAQTNVNADKVLHQTMMYIGEWVDDTTENLNAISDKTDILPDLQKNINDIKTTLPDVHYSINDIKSSIPDLQYGIEDIKSAIPETSKQIEDLKQRFEHQEEKIALLENKLEEILSKMEDNAKLQKKTEKIEKMLVSLSANIEKLTSYVDE